MKKRILIIAVLVMVALTMTVMLTACNGNKFVGTYQSVDFKYASIIVKDATNVEIKDYIVGEIVDSNGNVVGYGTVSGTGTYTATNNNNNTYSIVANITLTDGTKVTLTGTLYDNSSIYIISGGYKYVK